jgi:hypothetical protein
MKGSFFIVPNREYLDELDPKTLAVYIWLCLYADNDGKSFPTRKILSEKSQVEIHRLDKSIAELTKMGLVEKMVRKVDKENLSNVYQIMLLPSKRGYAKTQPPSAGASTTPGVQTGTVTIPSINYINTDVPSDSISSEQKEPTNKKETTPGTPFDYSVILKMLKESPKIYDKIIALYFIQKRYLFENKSQYQEAYRRNIRTARQLEKAGYTGEAFRKTMEYCEKEYKKVGWTLETVAKKLADVINTD